VAGGSADAALVVRDRGTWAGYQARVAIMALGRPVDRGGWGGVGVRGPHVAGRTPCRLTVAQPVGTIVAPGQELCFRVP